MYKFPGNRKNSETVAKIERVCLFVAKNINTKQLTLDFLLRI